MLGQNENPQRRRFAPYIHSRTHNVCSCFASKPESGSYLIFIWGKHTSLAAARFCVRPHSLFLPLAARLYLYYLCTSVQHFHFLSFGKCFHKCRGGDKVENILVATAIIQ